MGFTTRKLSLSDYDDILVGWWSDWGFTPPLRQFLPEVATGGIMVYDGDTPVCAGFLYATNSGIAWIDWIVSNKQYRKKPERREALDLLISSLTAIGQASGFSYIYTLFKNNHLISTFERAGFVQGCEYTGEMIKAL
jgi:hypothetical protein